MYALIVCLPRTPRVWLLNANNPGDAARQVHTALQNEGRTAFECDGLCLHDCIAERNVGRVNFETLLDYLFYEPPHQRPRYVLGQVLDEHTAPTYAVHYRGTHIATVQDASSEFLDMLRGLNTELELQER